MSNLGFNELYYSQDVFTKKVLAQKDDIDLIAATAVGATENIRDGNEELRKAIQNQVRSQEGCATLFTRPS